MATHSFRFAAFLCSVPRRVSLLTVAWTVLQPCWVDDLKIRSTGAFHYFQAVWHSAWHFCWCAVVPRGDSWRITCCDALNSLRNSQDRTKKPATIRPALDPRQVRYQAALRPDSEDPRFYCGFTS